MRGEVGGVLLPGESEPSDPGSCPQGASLPVLPEGESPFRETVVTDGEGCLRFLVHRRETPMLPRSRKSVPTVLPKQSSSPRPCFRTGVPDHSSYADSRGEWRCLPCGRRGEGIKPLRVVPLLSVCVGGCHPIARGTLYTPVDLHGLVRREREDPAPGALRPPLPSVYGSCQTPLGTRSGVFETPVLVWFYGLGGTHPHGGWSKDPVKCESVHFTSLWFRTD